MAIATPKPDESPAAAGWKAALAKLWYPKEYLLYLPKYPKK